MTGGFDSIDQLAKMLSTSKGRGESPAVRVTGKMNRSISRNLQDKENACMLESRKNMGCSASKDSFSAKTDAFSSVSNHDRNISNTRKIRLKSRSSVLDSSTNFNSTQLLDEPKKKHYSLR